MGYNLGKNKFTPHLLSAFCVPGTVLDIAILSKVSYRARKEKKIINLNQRS